MVERPLHATRSITAAGFACLLERLDADPDRVTAQENLAAVGPLVRPVLSMMSNPNRLPVATAWRIDAAPRLTALLDANIAIQTAGARGMFREMRPPQPAVSRILSAFAHRPHGRRASARRSFL